MSFGLENAPAAFSQAVATVSSPLGNKFVLCFLDDILIRSATFTEHLEHVRAALIRFREVNLKLKPSKCEFCKQKLVFLGHVISADGVSPDPDKITKILNFPPPHNLRSLRAFLGLCGYYRSLTKDFSKRALALTALTKKDNNDGKNFDWTPACQSAFEDLRSALTSDTTMAFPDFSLDFILQCDASLLAYGAVLSQF